MLAAVLMMSLGAAPHEVRLAAGSVELVLSHDPATGAVTLSGLRAGGTGRPWLAPSPVYALRVTGPDTQTHEVSSLDAHASVVLEQGDGQVSATLLRADLPLEVRVTVRGFPGHGFARQTISATNRGDRPLVLEEVALSSWILAAPPAGLRGHYGLERVKTDKAARWFRLHDYDGAGDPGLSFEARRWGAAAWLMLWRTDIPEGLTAAWETCAPVTCRLDGAGDASNLRALVHPVWRLEPGERFDAPGAVVGTYQGDTDEGIYRAHRFLEEDVAWPNPGDDFPYLMFNSWGYERAIDDALAREAIARCADLGVEVFVADFGWEGPDWLPLPDRFPHGLAPLSDLCHERSMKFGIHLSFGNVADEARVRREHPDWVYGEGCWAYGQGRLPVHALSLGLPEAREWAADTVARVIDRERVDWFLTDTHLWGPIDPATHTLKGDQDYLAATGFEATIDAIRARRPGVLIEHCDGGLSLLNYRMMAQHVTSITCDNAQAQDTRMSVYDLSRVLPPRYLDKYQQEWRSHYANRSCMFGGPWILMMPIHTLVRGSEDWNDLVEDIRLHKATRSLIREGKVLHLLAPGEPDDPGWDGWDAIGSWHRSRDAGVVFVFRTRGGPDTRTVPMSALRPDGRYHVRYVDSGQAYTASGADILRDGLVLALAPYRDDPRGHCSEVVLIDPAP